MCATFVVISQNEIECGPQLLMRNSNLNMNNSYDGAEQKLKFPISQLFPEFSESLQIH